MLGFLFRMVFVVALVVGIGGFVMVKKGNMALPSNLSDLSGFISKLPLDKTALSQLKDIDSKTVLTSASSALDAIVTHPGRNSGPVVLGVNVSNESINTVVDVLQNLPNEQVEQIRSALCATPASE